MLKNLINVVYKNDMERINEFDINDNIMNDKHFKLLYNMIFFVHPEGWGINREFNNDVPDDFWELGEEFVNYLNYIKHDGDIKYLFINYFANKTPSFEYMKYIQNEDLSILENSIYYDNGWKIYKINMPNRYYELGKEYIKNFNGNKEMVINHLHVYISRELKYKIGYESQYIDFVKEKNNDG